jgi:hypothetical protein
VHWCLVLGVVARSYEHRVGGSVRRYGAVLSAEVMGLQLGADRFLGMRKNFLPCWFV